MSNIVKYSGFQRSVLDNIPVAADYQSCSLFDDLFVFGVFFRSDSVHSSETFPPRGDVFLQDQQPRVLPAGGPRHAAFPG